MKLFLNQAVLCCGERNNAVGVGDGVVGVCLGESPWDGELVGIGLAAGRKRHLDDELGEILQNQMFLPDVLGVSQMR